MPEFSIIIPVYNNEKYLPLAIESILSQDYKDFELIIVDDGSTDHTPEIVDSIAQMDERIHVIHQKNQWIHASVNHGIEIAEGNYIYIVNSDDRLKPGSLSCMAKKIQQYQPDVIWTKVVVYKCNENQEIIGQGYINYDKTLDEEIFFNNEEEVRDNWLLLYKNDLVQNQINLYRREIMRKHKFRTDIYGADVLFNISIASDIKSALILKEVVYDHFNYSSQNMNASIGKYYGYEHEMFNDFYLEYIKLFAQWNRLDDGVKQFLGKRRMKLITYELHSLQYPSCKLSIEEKIETIFGSYLDGVVYQCAKDLDCVEELEARILSGIRELLVKDELKPESDVYFVYEFMNSLLRYEKSEDDFRKIKQAVFDPLNKYHIGLSFYNKLKENCGR